MRRRELLATGAVAMTGCVGGDSDAESEPTGGDGNGTDTNADTDTDANDRPTARVEVTNAELIRAESRIGEVPWAVVDISNDTDSVHGVVRAQIVFRDGDENVLTTRMNRAEIVPDRMTWRSYHLYTRVESNEPETVEVSLTRADSEPSMVVDNGIGVRNTNMDVSDGVVRVTGELQPAAQPRHSILVLLYDEEGFRGTILQPTTGTAFEAASSGFSTPTEYLPISDYQVLIIRHT